MTASQARLWRLRRAEQQRVVHDVGHLEHRQVAPELLQQRGPRRRGQHHPSLGGPVEVPEGDLNGEPETDVLGR